MKVNGCDSALPLRRVDPLTLIWHTVLFKTFYLNDSVAMNPYISTKVSFYIIYQNQNYYDAFTFNGSLLKITTRNPLGGFPSFSLTGVFNQSVTC